MTVYYSSQIPPEIQISDDIRNTARVVASTAGGGSAPDTVGANAARTSAVGLSATAGQPAAPSSATTVQTRPPVSGQGGRGPLAGRGRGGRRGTAVRGGAGRSGGRSHTGGGRGTVAAPVEQGAGAKVR